MMSYTGITPTSFKKHALAISLGLIIQPLAWAAPAVNALPVLDNIASGSAHISKDNSQNKLTVNQQTDKLVANWNSFNVGENAQVIFNQPSASSIALNRIGGSTASQIFGQVSANGQLILVNPAGLTIGSSGQVAASSVIASTLDISNNDFNAGKLTFNRNNASGEIINEGNIKALNGSSSLLASSIKTSGTVSAKNGNINLANGNQLTLAADMVTVNQAAKAASLIQSTGSLQASRVSNSNGRVYILGDRFDSASHVDLGGNINAVISHINGKNINVTGRLNSRNSISLTAANNINVQQALNLIGDNQQLSMTYSVKPFSDDGLHLAAKAQINLLGNGTKFRANSKDYTVIRSIEDLQAINSSTTSLSGLYVLGNNIDASATANWNNGSGFSPIGGNQPAGSTDLLYFSGIFNGLGHSIDALNIQRNQSYIGLFGAAKNANIQNIKLSNAHIVGSGYVGGLIGDYISTDQVGLMPTIINNTLTGSVSNTDPNDWNYNATGGLIGRASNSGNLLISQNTLKVNVSGAINVGGLIGSSYNFNELNITTNTVKGAVFADSAAGGLIGNNYVTNYKQSISNNNIATSVKSAGLLNEDYPGMFGGLIGANQINQSSLTIENNLLTGRIDAGNMKTGGLIGSNLIGDYFSSVRIKDNQLSGNILSSYATPAPDHQDLQDGDAVGGLIGYNASQGSLMLEHNKVSGNVVAAGNYTGGLIGYSKESSSLWVANNQVSGKVIGGAYTGGLIGYTSLNGGPARDESGPSKLTLIANSVSNAILGQQYTGGLVGQLNLTSASLSMTSSHSTGVVNGTNYIGGLIGQLNQSVNYYPEIAPDASITTSYSSAKVSGNQSIGGLIGAAHLNTGNLQIGNTYKAKPTIASAARIGGLIGEIKAASKTSARIFNSYATGSISGSSATGGLIGYSSGTGSLQVERSFWDINSTGQPVSIGGTGLSSEQMKQLSTYAGWSINVNPAGDSIWYIKDGISAPTLRP